MNDVRLHHTIGFRIMAAFIGIVLLLLVQAGFGAYTISAVKRVQQNAFAYRLPLEQLTNRLSEMQIDISTILGTQNVEVIETLSAKVDADVSEIAEAMTAFQLPTASLEASLETFHQILELHWNFETKKAYDLLNTTAKEQYEDILGHLNTLSAKLEQNTAHAIRQTDTNAFVGMLGMCVLGIGVAMILGRYLSRSITRPLQQAVNVAHRLAEGDVSVNMAVTHHDETGQLQQAMQNMLAYIRQIADLAQQIAVGNVQVHVTPRSDCDVLNHAFTAMTQYLQQVAAVAERVSKNDLQVDVVPQSERDTLNQAIRKMVENLRLLMADNERAMAEAEQQRVEAQHQQLVAEQQRQEAEQQRIAAEKQRLTVEQQSWLRSGLAELANLMRGEQDARTLSKNVITFISKYLDVPVGAIYLLHGRNGDSALRLSGSYAYLRRKGSRHEFRLGESMVGQAALEKEQIAFTNIPQEYLAVGSGLGGSTPRHLLVTPFLYERDVKGVIELASVQEFSNRHLEFLKQATENIGIAFQTVDNRAQLQNLLGATQQQAEELQQQQEELRQTNEELGEQTQALQLSESRLQQQQEELRQTNEELEQQTRELVKQQDEVKEKNRALEQASKLLEARAKDLEIASKYKSEFLANMSHELRTPLNSMLILSNLLAQNKDHNLTDKQIEFARTVHTSGQELLTLINEVLDLSKVEAGRMELNLADMNLQGLANYIEQHFAHVAQEKKLYLKIDVADDIPGSIYADRQRIEQIVKNFLSNAFKFTTEGGITLRISRPGPEIQFLHRTLDPQRAIAIAIADTGIGIPQDKQRLIFEAFQQADGSTSRKYGGTGLGLSISREMAKLLGGEIQLHSEAGQGSTFTLFLPESVEAPSETRPENGDLTSKASVSEPPRILGGDGEKNFPSEASGMEGEREQKLPSPERRGAGDEVSSGTEVASGSEVSVDHHSQGIDNIRDDRHSTEPGDKSLLIIEDDPKFVAILFDLARERGFKVLVAGDGSAGLQLAYQYLPGAIILDVGLPGTDGWVVKEKLFANPETEPIPVYMISAHDAPSTIEQHGILGYLTKPVSPESLDEVFHTIETHGIERRCGKALIVEDDDVMRTSLTELLREHLPDVSTASTGEDAIALLRNGTFTCLVLDLGLPDMSGFDFLDRVTQDASVPPLHIIVYTGRDLTKDEDRQLQHYTHSVIIKGARSADRLLDEMTLLLHQVERSLPQDHQRKPQVLRDKDAVLDGKTILVVDDDVRNVYALANVLDDKGLNIITAENGIQALEELDTQPDAVNLVLMDIMMPEMDGYEATRAIRKQPRFHKLPILALTAKAMKGDRQKCLEAGANDYLSKPIDTEKLFSLLRVWLY